MLSPLLYFLYFGLGDCRLTVLFHQVILTLVKKHVKVRVSIQEMKLLCSTSVVIVKGEGGSGVGVEQGSIYSLGPSKLVHEIRISSQG